MKLVIALAFLAVVSAFPPSPRLGYRGYEGYPMDVLGSHYNKLPQSHNDLIKSYEDLIENLNHLARVDEEEEAVNGVIDAIIAIGQIINANGIGDDRPPKPQLPENEESDDISNKPSVEIPKIPEKELEEDKIRPSAPNSKEENPASSEEDIISPLENEKQLDSAEPVDGAEDQLSSLSQEDEERIPHIAEKAEAIDETPAL